MQFYRHLCRECGGSGLVEYEPVNPGWASVTESCHVCKGKYQDEYWECVKAEKEHDKGNDN